jgi:hypothetical protein
MSTKKQSDAGANRGFSFLYIIGAILAAASSFTLNHSIGWAIVNGIFSWWYLIYLCAGFGGGLPPQIF